MQYILYILFIQYISAFTQSRIQSHFSFLKCTSNTFSPYMHLNFESNELLHIILLSLPHIHPIFIHIYEYIIVSKQIAHSLPQWKHNLVCFGEHLRWAQWEGFIFMSLQAFWLDFKNMYIYSSVLLQKMANQTQTKQMFTSPWGWNTEWILPVQS